MPTNLGLSLHFKPNLQSAVRILHFLLTEMKTQLQLMNVKGSYCLVRLDDFESV